MELSAGLQVQTIASDLWRGVGVRGGTVDGWRVRGGVEKWTGCLSSKQEAGVSGRQCLPMYLRTLTVAGGRSII